MKLSCVWLLISCGVCFRSARWTLVWSLAAEKWCQWLCLALGEAQKPFLRPVCFSFCLPQSQSAALLCLPQENCCCCRCADLFCGHRPGVSGGERLTAVISPCLASGQAADCFSGLVPPGGICLQEKFPYSQVWAAELWLSQRHCFWLLRWINYVTSNGVGAGNVCGCSEWKSCS